MKWVDVETGFNQQLRKVFFNKQKDKKYLLAVSGGLDSMVLWYLFQKSGLNYAVAHCNFGLRGVESDEDEIFVSKHANKENVKFHVKEFQLDQISHKNKSTQMAARDLRYEWFAQLVKNNNFDYLVTAHHADDNLETLLLNMIRGTGIDGLTGISSLENNIFRPLLAFEKSALQLFAVKNNIQFRQDSSNFSTKYKRNKIRLEVIPKLKEINPSITETILEHIPLYFDLRELLLEQTKLLKEHHCVQKGNYFIIDQKILLAKPGKLNILHQLLTEFGFSYKQLLFLIEGRLTHGGTKIESKTHELYLHSEKWFIAPIIKDFEPIVLEKIPDILSTNFGNFIFKLTNLYTKPESKNQLILDLNKIVLPLTIRTRKDGDWFYPEGMQGKKQKLKDYFINEKYAIPEKDSQLLLCCGDEIIWLVGKRRDHRFIMLEDTCNNYLTITFMEN